MNTNWNLSRIPIFLPYIYTGFGGQDSRSLHNTIQPTLKSNGTLRVRLGQSTTVLFNLRILIMLNKRSKSDVRCVKRGKFFGVFKFCRRALSSSEATFFTAGCVQVPLNSYSSLVAVKSCATKTNHFPVEWRILWIF